MVVETSPWDSAQLLDTPEALAAYIEAAIEDGDMKRLTHALGVAARAKGMSSVAAQAGVTREALYKALSAEGDPRLSTLTGVLKALGLRLTVEAA